MKILNASQSTDDPVITGLSEVSCKVEEQVVTQNNSSGDGTEKDCSKVKSTSTKADKRSFSILSHASTTATRAPTDELQKLLEKRREREKTKDDFESKVFGSKK